MSRVWGDGTQRVVDSGGRIEALYLQRAKNVSAHFLVNNFYYLKNNQTILKTAPFFVPETYSTQCTFAVPINCTQHI